MTRTSAGTGHSGRTNSVPSCEMSDTLVVGENGVDNAPVVIKYVMDGQIRSLDILNPVLHVY